ncbi:MAG: cupredoxin domain-containing protein [Gemmatimonadota bacterium]|nr:cupredoxin domain-containing protein [Gemmatimonadota bacterium]MDH5198299.1 cupredoxin domain-containing protein [Gemmatimonadota bacterium]
MSALDVIVMVVGAALIGWELWYFLGATTAERPRGPSGAQEVQVRVHQGFEPDVIPVEVGRPVRLLFYRDEAGERTGEVIFETLDLRRALPAFQTTAVEFTPEVPGDYPFRCGHTEYRGRVVAQAGAPVARTDPGRGHRRHG